MYIGNDLQIAHPSYKIIDDISSGFNGSTTSFALQVSGATPVPFPISTQQVMISVNGVVQEPDPTGSAGFKLLGSNIVFSSAPANGHAFFGVINAGADYVTAGSEFPDGSATAPSFTFQDDQDTGWFRSGSGAVGYSANGVQTLTFDGNGLTIAGGKGLTVDTSTLKVDAANNRVGIGTASPSATLDLQGSANTDGVKIFGGSSGNNSPLKVGVTNGTEYFRVNHDGKVGIGVNAPAELLHLKTSSGNCKIRIDAAATPSIDFYEAGTRNSDIMVDHSSNELIITNRQAASINFRTDGANERMRLNSEGCLLVGTTARSTSGASNNALLTVAGNRASATGEGQLNLWKKAVPGVDDTLGQINFIGDGGDPGAVIKGEADLAWDQGGDTTDHPGRILFCTTADNAANVTERLRIDSKGDLMLGAVGQYNDITGHGGGLLIGPGTGSDSGIMLRSSSSGVGRIYFGDNSGSDNGRKDGFIVYSQSNRTLSLGTAQHERYLIGSAGQFGIAGANYGSSGQVFTSSGAGTAPGWTTISAAPQVTATVDGSLSANDAVILKTTGNVEKITETISINNPATFGGVRQEIGPENQTQSFIQVTSSAKKSVVTLYQEGNQGDRGRYYIWAYDGNGGWAFGNWGANKSYVSHGITFLDSCYYPGTNQIFIVSMPWNNNNRVAIGSGRFNDWTGSGGNDEGTDISWSSKTVALGTTNNRTNAGNNPARCAVDMGAGHFYTIFKDDNDDDIEVYYAAATTSGGVTIESTPSTPNGTTDCSNQVAVGAGNGLVLIAYQHDNGNSYLRAGKYDASATGKVTWGSAAEITNQTNTTTGAYFDISYNTGAGAFVFVWCDDNKPKCKAVTVNSSTLAITQGSNQQLDSNNCTYTSVGYDETTKSNPIAWRRNNNQDGFVRTATVSGTTITLTSSTSNAFETNNVNTGTPAQKFQIQDMKVYGVSIIGYRQNNQQFGEVRHLDAGSSSTNLTTENFLGFSSAAYSNGNTGTINVVGNTTTKSGLTPAQDYYVQRDGTIKTDPAEIVGSVLAGKALSSTKLLIKG